MTSSFIEKEVYIDFEKELREQHLDTFIKPALKKFYRIIKFSTFLHAVFVCAISLEIIYLACNLLLLLQNFVLAIHLGLMFATLFSYLSLRLYFHTHTTEKYLNLKNDFIQACKNYIHYQEGLPAHHVYIANTCCRLATELHGKEYTFFLLPGWLEFLTPYLEKLSCWLYWRDIHFMKEILLRAAIEEHIQLVKNEPTSLEAHASLANAYVMLSGLYVDPRTIEGMGEERWIPPQKYNTIAQQKFRQTAQCAIEEFKILNDFAPQDPWVHAQLAYSYRDLQMPLEEIAEYEIIMRLCPDDQENLFKLGKLYFEQGFNAKGLKIYEMLRNSHYKKAETLIHFYGSYQLN